MSVIDRLEDLGRQASERPWTLVSPYGAVVTQGRCANPTNGAEDRDAYGGALIFESCGLVDREFITAVVNALPDLLKTLRAFADEECGESGTTRERCWDQNEEDWPRGSWCRRCTALEPLLREIPS